MIDHEIDSAFFLIESGKALELVKHHLAEVQRVRRAAAALAKELAVERYVFDRFTGVMIGYMPTEPKPHPDFKKPDRKGACYPKRGSDWARKLQAQKGYEPVSALISNAFGIPLSLAYAVEGGKGWSRIGHMLTECGFLYLSGDGPYAMWVPDVEAEIKARQDKGCTITDPSPGYRLEIPGARRIEREEWDILVAQHTLAEKRAAKEGGAA